jgi:flavin-dependent dehydrogenase
VINMAYDVIVVGARVAGSSTGMLLARSGLRVLVVDQTSFPGDTLSSHQAGLAKFIQTQLRQPRRPRRATA